jgi:hypothetical protein
MEPQFKTSFIPKQSLAKTAAPRRRGGGVPTGAGLVVSLVIFLAAAGSAGSLYLYKQFLIQNIEEKSGELRRAREAFQPSLILDLARLDSRLIAAQDILEAHISPSVVFSLLEQTTLRSVRYNTMSLVADTTGAVSLTMNGTATSFEGVALQSDVLGSNQYIRDLVVSNLQNAEEGLVSFSVNATIDPRLLLYERSLDNPAGGGS